MTLLGAILLVLGAGIMTATLALGWLFGAPGIGPHETIGLLTGAGVCTIAKAAGLPSVRRAIEPVELILVRVLVLTAISLVGLSGLEVWGRHRAGFMPLVTPLYPSSFVEKDRVRVYNRAFAAERAHRFSDWPIPLAIFDSDVPVPRYLFKPNMRMAISADRLVPAAEGEAAFWSSNSWGF